MSGQESCQTSIEQSAKCRRRRRPWRLEVRPAAILYARMPVGRPAWARRPVPPGGRGATGPPGRRKRRFCRRFERKCRSGGQVGIRGVRRPVRRPSWPPGDPFGGRLGRQEARLQAVLDARRPVRRLSWTPGGPSARHLGRQEARMQVLLQFCSKMQGISAGDRGGARSPESKDARRTTCVIF